MRAFADRTRRGLSGLGKRLHFAIDVGSASGQPTGKDTEQIPSGERRRHPADRELVGESPSIDEFRTPFSRELGDAWIEVEPGIYAHAADAAPASLDEGTMKRPRGASILP